MATIRLTMAQALVRYLAAQRTECDGRTVPLFGGVWAIFGHGNVAGIGEALAAHRADLPTYRAHNEQAMALAAIGYAKAMHRRRMMACTTSIGPGATNMITAAAVAHVDRLPVLLLPGDVFASRRPDPVLQQVESFGDGTVSANDCFRPVSRYFDRITRPEQILTALPRALSVLTDPAECGPGDAGAVPGRAGRGVRLSRNSSLRHARLACPSGAAGRRRTGGGGGSAAPRQGAADHRRRRRALLRGDRGARSLRHRARHPGRRDPGGQECTAARSSAAISARSASPARRRRTQAAEAADVILAVGTRLQDFTTGSWALFQNPARRLIGLNVQVFDAAKHHMQPLVADARVGADRAGRRARRPPRARCLAAPPDRRRRHLARTGAPPSPRHPTPNCRRMRR